MIIEGRENMKILLLGGIFDDSHNEEIISKTRTYVEYAANNFQKKIIQGFKENGIEIQVISAPFIGAYPKAYSDIYFKGFDSGVNDESGFEYVKFLNLWGIRNISRYQSLKNAVKQFIDEDDPEKLIIVYTPHTPLLKAANFAKKHDERIKVCMVVPDLPQYMNLSNKISFLYKIMKKYDIKEFQRENKLVDSYVILTEQMADELDIGTKPYCVIEGIYQNFSEIKKDSKENDLNTIVYTGKLDNKFGIMNLINAFMLIKNDKLRLLICGSGEEKDNVEKCALQDQRIIFKGQVSSDEARRYAINADILINPRQNNSNYTKFSFPSKIIDYLATGNPVIAYKLDGMPDIYDQFIYFVPDNSVETLKNTIENVLKDSEKDIRAQKAKEYLCSEISQKNVAKKILTLNFKKGES